MRKTSLAGFRLDESLRIGEDTDFILRLAKNLKLLGEPIDREVAIRRIHGNNSIVDKSSALKGRRELGLKIVQKRFYGSKDVIANIYLLMKYVSTFKIYQGAKKIGRVASVFVATIIASIFLVFHPSVVLHLFGICLNLEHHSRDFNTAEDKH
jgi:hypothetical protein